MNKLNLFVLSAILLLGSNLTFAEDKKPAKQESEGKRVARVFVGAASLFAAYKLGEKAYPDLNVFFNAHLKNDTVSKLNIDGADFFGIDKNERLAKASAMGFGSFVLGIFGLNQIYKAIK